MRTEFYEADPFGGSRGNLLVAIESDYRWEKVDAVRGRTGDEKLKLRVTWVNGSVRDGVASRELLELKL